MMVYEFDDFVILDVKDIDHRCVLQNMTKHNAVNWLNNSKLDDKGTL